MKSTLSLNLALVASLLPVWTLLQPRDYINSHQLFVGLSLLFLGIFVAQPIVDAPAIRSFSDPSTPSLFPLLFVTIACGAISGFHGLVSSGTSSKQLEKLLGVLKFGKPKELTHAEILDVIDRFIHAGEIAKQTGFRGVQLHSAHGYLLSEFLV